MSAQDITAIATSIIAAIALFIAIWDVNETRRHNRMTAKPRLEFKYEFVTSKGTVGLFLDNVGLGPAIITSFRVFINGDQINVSYDKIWPTVFSLIALNDNLTHWLTWTSYGSAGRSIPAGEREDILTVLSRNLNSTRLEIMNNLIPSLVIEIDYNSAYGEKFHTFLTENPKGVLDDLIEQAKEAEKKGYSFT